MKVVLLGRSMAFRLRCRRPSWCEFQHCRRQRPRSAENMSVFPSQGEKMVSVWLVPVAGNTKPVAVVQPPSSQSNISAYRVSPDGHWVAYASDESGQLEIYITSFPEGKGKWRVSANSGTYPAWSGNGRELFFENVTNDYFVCSVTAKESDLTVGAHQRLFHTSTHGWHIV